MKTLQLFFLTIIILTVVSCKKDKGDLSTVETYSPEYIASTAATIGCYVRSDGGTGIASCGVYLSGSANAESTGTRLEMGNDTGLYLGRVTGLLPGIQYYMKAYASNSKGEALGAEVSFTTPQTIKDADNNVYETVIIGSQMWMAANLKTTKYQNGDLIATTSPATLNIVSESSPKYQWAYSGIESNVNVYGRLYTQYAVADSRKVCPAGWHIPSDAEWTALELKLGTYEFAGSRLKETGNDHWKTPYNLDATNESCFTALPGGYRDSNGTFYMLQDNGYWWSSTQSQTNGSWVRSLSSNAINISRSGANNSFGISVRCVKD